MIISFNIPDDKIPRIVKTMKDMHPIPLINVGTEEEPVYEPEFTENQWAKEAVRRWIIRQVARYEQREAKEAIKFNLDETLVS